MVCTHVPKKLLFDCQSRAQPLGLPYGDGQSPDDGREAEGQLVVGPERGGKDAGEKLQGKLQPASEQETRTYVHCTCRMGMKG